MPTVAKPGRLSKEGGWCAQCQSQDVLVQHDPVSKLWLCLTCWPPPTKVTQKTEWEQAWDRRNPTEAARLKLRDEVYGIRIEDEEREEFFGSFVVRCPDHGVVGMDLTIMAARRLRDEHIDEHFPVPA